MALRVGLPTGGFSSGLLVAAPDAFVAGSLSGTIGLVTETDTAQAVVGIRGTQLGVATESAIATPMGRVKRKAIGLTVSPSEARPILFAFAGELGIGLEIDSAETMGRLKEMDAEEVEEIDGALSMNVGAPPLIVQQAVESSAALAISGRKVRATGQASEAGTALAAALRRGNEIGLVTEVQSARPMTAIWGAGIFVPIGIATDVGIPLALAHSKLRALGLPIETSTAFTHSIVSATTTVIPIGLATELEETFGVSFQWIVPIEPAPELDAALSLLASRGHTIGLAHETDAAFPLALFTRFRYRGRPGLGVSVSGRTGFRRF